VFISKTSVRKIRNITALVDKKLLSDLKSGFQEVPLVSNPDLMIEYAV